MRRNTSFHIAAVFCLVGLVSACRPQGASNEDACARSRCVTVEDDDGTSPLGVVEDGRGTNGGYVVMCRLVVRRPARGSAPGFTSETVAQAGQVTILDGTLAEVVRCEHANGHTVAVLRMDPPEHLWAVPDPASVFVPLEVTSTRLEDGARLHAGITYADGNVCLAIARPGDEERHHCDLRVGDTFPSGAKQAAVVRIVRPTPTFVGWIELAIRN